MIVVIKALNLSLSLPLAVYVNKMLLNNAAIVAPETITPIEKLPFKGYIASHPNSIKTGTIGIKKNPNNNY